MTDTDTIRRATDHEIATARAWVEHAYADVGHSPELDAERQSEYEHALEVLIFANGGRRTPPRPTVVCLCGSTRFVDEFNRQRVALTRAGEIVLSIELVTTQAREDDPQHVAPDVKARLDELHKRKIDLADYVLVLDVNGYVGESTRSEIAYAEAMGKPVRYLSREG